MLGETFNKVWKEVVLDAADAREKAFKNFVRKTDFERVAS